MKPQPDSCKRERHMPIVWFIRHGESESNANLKTTHPAESAITPKGEREARRIVAAFETAPDLIVVSPFLRARQTAVPTQQAFPGTPVETWPVEEFTYLHPRHYDGTTGAERRQIAVAYWEANDPFRKDGGEGESFAELLARTEAVKNRLAASSARFIALFSHGLFLRALLHAEIMSSYAPTPRMMERYSHFVRGVHMPNGAILKANVEANGRFTFSGIDAAHLTA